jgi:hypothetical protein
MNSIPIKGVFKKRKKEVLSKFNEEEILEISFRSDFYGVASRRFKQIRGYGILVLAKEKLYFEMYYPRKEVNIPLKSIVEIKTPKSFRGKTRFRKLLEVVFVNKEGKTDLAA